MINILQLLTIFSLYNPNFATTQVSYYSQPQQTASGEYFTGNELTCASPDLPFGTLVTLRYNSNIITVRVNDRGPYAIDSRGDAIFPLSPHPSRKFDLSICAFNELTENTSIGVAEVEVVLIEVIN